MQQAPRNKLTFRFAAPSFALSDLPPAGAAARAVAAAHTAAATHGAGDEPVPIALLRSIDAEGEISIGELALANGSCLSDLLLQIKLQDGRLDVPALQASVFGGTVIANLSLDAAHQPTPALALHAQMKGMDLGALLAAVGARREVRGGKTDGRIDIGATGNTPRQWESTMSGTVIALVGPATLGKHEGRSEFAAEQARRYGQSVPQCRSVDRAAMRGDSAALHNGVAEVERSIAVETKIRRHRERQAGLSYADAGPRHPAATPAGSPAGHPAGCRSGSFPRAVRFTRGRDRFGRDRCHHRPQSAQPPTPAVCRSSASRCCRGPAAIPAKSRSAEHRAQAAQMAGGGAGMVVEDLGKALGRAFHR